MPEDESCFHQSGSESSRSHSKPRYTASETGLGELQQEDIHEASESQASEGTKPIKDSEEPTDAALSFESERVKLSSSIDGAAAAVGGQDGHLGVRFALRAVQTGSDRLPKPPSAAIDRTSEKINESSNIEGTRAEDRKATEDAHIITINSSGEIKTELSPEQPALEQRVDQSSGTHVVSRVHRITASGVSFLEQTAKRFASYTRSLR